jgi:uncharacterized protein with HEPN domain
MLAAIEEIEQFARGMNAAALAADVKTLRAVMANFAIIGEAARHVPDDVAARFPDVPWRQMRDMRNWVVHVYFSVDPDIILTTIRTDLPETARALRRMLD